MMDTAQEEDVSGGDLLAEVEEELARVGESVARRDRVLRATLAELRRVEDILILPGLRARVHSIVRSLEVTALDGDWT